MEDKKHEVSVPFDKEEFWVEISTHEDFPVKKEKKRRGFFFILFGALLAVLTLWFLQRPEPKGHSNSLDQKTEGIEETATSLLKVETPDNQSIGISTSSIEQAISKTNQTLESAAVKQNIYPISQREFMAEKPATTVTRGYRLIADPINTNAAAFKKMQEVGRPTFARPESLQKRIQNLVISQDGIVEAKQFLLTASILEGLKEIGVEQSIQDSTSNLKTIHWKWAFSILSGIESTTDDIIYTGLGLEAFYADRSISKPVYFGARARKTIKQTQWFIGLGIDYSGFYNSYQGKYQRSGYRPNSQSSSPYFIHVDSTLTFSMHHQHRLVNGVLELGRVLPISDSWSSSFYLGTNINLTYNVEGMLYDSNLNLYELPDDLYKPNLAPRFFIGGAINKNITDSFIWSVGIRLQSGLTLSKSDALNHKLNWQYGIQTSFSYLFGRKSS